MHCALCTMHSIPSTPAPLDFCVFQRYTNFMDIWERLGTVTGFDWDEGNRDKNWEKHKVSSFECEEFFFNRPLVVNSSGGRGGQEERYFALGQTGAGRMLFVVFTLRGEKIRVISARPMSRSEREVYLQHE